MSWLERLELRAVVGDIFTADAEGLVCSVTTELGAYGGLSRRLYAMGGTALEGKIRSARAALPDGRLGLGQAVTLPSGVLDRMPGIGHLILVALWSHENPYTFNLVYQVLINALRQAFEHELASLAVPIFHVGRDLYGEAVVSVLRDLDGLKRSGEFSVTALSFISIKDEDVAALGERLKGLER